MILTPVLRHRYLDANGKPLAGGKLYSYQAGTSTPQATYSNSTGTTNANPVILDANGEANVFIDPSLSYKFTLNNSSDVLQWTQDNVYASTFGALIRDVVFKTFADSPITLTTTNRGNFYVIDCTSGNVSINLPQISGIDFSIPFSFAVKKSDSSANTVTINRASSDTIDGSSTKVLATQGAGVLLTPDTDPSPDVWTALEFGGLADGSVTRLKLAVGAVPKYNVVTKTTTYTATSSDDLILVDGSGGGWTLSLPTAVGISGKFYEIKRTDSTPANTVTVDPNGAETIDGVATLPLVAQYEAISIISDGANWRLLNDFKMRASGYKDNSYTISGGVATKISFNNKVFDTHSAYDAVTNFRWTAPRACVVRVSASAKNGAHTWSVGDVLRLQVFKTGVAYRVISDVIIVNTGSQGYTVVGSTIMSLAAGDYVEFFLTDSQGATWTPVATTTWFDIEEI